MSTSTEHGNISSRTLLLRCYWYALTAAPDTAAAHAAAATAAPADHTPAATAAAAAPQQRHVRAAATGHQRL